MNSLVFLNRQQKSERTLGQSSVYDGVHWFTSKEEILEDETIVGIAAQGRVSQNLTFAREILEHGKHVWFDKPAGDNLDTFREVLDIARDRNLLVQLGYMFRYNAGFQFVLDWANSGKLGDIFSVRARISSSLSSEAHWQRWDSLGEHSGGIMFILACHLTDIIVALLGRTDTGDTLFEARWTRRAVGIGTIPRLSLNIQEHWRFLSQRRWKLIRVKQGDWKSTEHAAVQFLNRSNRQHCGYVLTKNGMDTVKVGRRCLWSGDRVYVESLRAFVADIRGEKSP